MVVSVHNPARAIVGLCPSCSNVIVLLNDHEAWPLATCPCGWTGTTTDLVDRVRYERGQLSGILNRTRLMLPPDTDRWALDPEPEPAGPETVAEL